MLRWCGTDVVSLKSAQQRGESLLLGGRVGLAGAHRRQRAVDLAVEYRPASVVQGLQGRLVVVPSGFEIRDSSLRPIRVAGLNLRKCVLEMVRNFVTSADGKFAIADCPGASVAVADDPDSFSLAAAVSAAGRRPKRARRQWPRRSRRNNRASPFRGPESSSRVDGWSSGFSMTSARVIDEVHDSGQDRGRGRSRW